MSTVTITIRVQPTSEVTVAPEVVPGEQSQVHAVQAPMALDELGIAADAIGPSPEDFVVGAVVADEAPEPMPLEDLEQALASPDPMSPTPKKTARTRS